MRTVGLLVVLAAGLGYQFLSEDAQIILGLFALVVALLAAMVWLLTEPWR